MAERETRRRMRKDCPEAANSRFSFRARFSMSAPDLRSTSRPVLDYLAAEGFGLYRFLCFLGGVTGVGFQQWLRRWECESCAEETKILVCCGWFHICIELPIKMIMRLCLKCFGWEKEDRVSWSGIQVVKKEE